MKKQRRRKCLHCAELFRPDPRNRGTDQNRGTYLYKRIEHLPQADGLGELENPKNQELG